MEWYIPQASKQSNFPGFTKTTTPSSCDSATPLLGIYLTEMPINMTNPDSILKSRDITLPTKVFIVKAVVFLVVMYGCESWTIKKAEHQGIDAFELWFWRRLLRVPWTARRSNQSTQRRWVLGVYWKDWCWSFNTLATWCEELIHWKRPWCWERLEAGGEGDNRGWDGWMASPTQWTWVWASSRRCWVKGKPGVLQSMGSQSWTQLSDETTNLLSNHHGGQGGSICWIRFGSLIHVWRPELDDGSDISCFFVFCFFKNFILFLNFT